MTNIDFTHDQYLRFKQEYLMSKQLGKSNFMFESNEYFTAYAKYLVEYLDERYIGKEEILKDQLRKRGFYVDNLWSIEDVKSRFECDNEEAYAVLEDAMTNEAVMERVWNAIYDAAEYNGLTPKED